MGQEKKVKAKSFLTLMLLTLGSRVLGLIRMRTQGHFIGGGAIGDAFTAGFIIPNFFRRLFAEASMTAAFVPTFKGYLKEGNKKETQDFINSIFTILTFAVSITVIIGIYSMPLLVKLLKAKDANINELILLTRIMFPYLAFISVAAIFQSLLNSLNIFAPGGFTPILFNVVVIITTYVLSRYMENAARAMSIGITLGGFCQMAFQIPFLIKTGYRASFRGLKKAITHPGTKKVGRLLAPTLIGAGVIPLNNVVASFIALDTGVGINSSLNYSLRLQELVLGIFAVTIGTILLSTLSKNVKEKNWEQYSKSLGLSINAISMITIPITLFAIIHSRELVELVYFTGQFDDVLLNMTSGVFKIHISALFFIAITRIVGPAFYALEDTKTPAYLGVASIGFSLLLMFILAPIMGANGIALAVTISSVVLMVSYSIFMSIKKDIGFKSIVLGSIPNFIKVLLFSSISVVPIYFFKDRIFAPFNFDSVIARLVPPLVITTFIFFGIYFLLLLLTKDQTVKKLLKTARKR